MAIPVIIDTDPGVDDALALLLAVASPEIYVHAVTVVGGNVALGQCVRNAAGVLAYAEASIPVASGLQAPCATDVSVHGEDGLGGATQFMPGGWRPVTASAVDLMLDCDPGITIIALGPLTNVAAASRKDPARFRRVSRVIAMGGAFGTHGNVTPVAEFNAWADPDAVNAVLGSGVPVTFVGLDVTMRTRLTTGDLPPDAPPFLQQMCRHMLGEYRARGLNGFALHDPLAVAAALQPDLVQTRPMRVEVETAGKLTRGETVADFRPWTDAEPNADVALDVDVPRFLELFRKRVFRAR